MSQNESPAGSFSYAWVETSGLNKVVIDEVTEVNGQLVVTEVNGKFVGMKRYVGSNSFALLCGESLDDLDLDITHKEDETGHDLTELVLRQTVSSPQERPPLAVPLRLIVEPAKAA